MTDWISQAFHEHSAYRIGAMTSRVVLNLGDDTGKVQTHQTEGFPGEVRNGVQRMEQWGFSGMPPKGATGIVIYAGGDRGQPTIIGVLDPRNRPTGLNPGEAQLYTHEGTYLQALAGKILKLLFTKLILQFETIEIHATTALTITSPTATISNGGATQAVKLADGSNSTVLKAQ